MPSRTTSLSSTLRRLFVLVLSGVMVVCLAAAPAEAKKKKKKKTKSDDETSADASSGSKKKKKKKSRHHDDAESDSKQEAKADKKEEAPAGKKARKEYSDDDEAPAKTKAASKSAPATKTTPPPAVPPIPPPAPLAEIPPPPPVDDAEVAISRTAGLGRLKLQHLNEVSSFRLTKLAYDLNSHAVFPEPGKPDPDFSSAKPIAIWEGVLPVGDNEVTVTAVYKGQGSFFSYLNDMTFVKTDKTKVKVVEGSVTTVTVTGEEDTSPFTQTEDRPRFDYKTEVAASKTATIR